MGNALFVCGSADAVGPQSTFYRAYKTNEAMMSKLKEVGLDQKHLYALHQIFSAMDKGASGACVSTERSHDKLLLPSRQLG